MHGRRAVVGGNSSRSNRMFSKAFSAFSHVSGGVIALFLTDQYNSEMMSTMMMMRSASRLLLQHRTCGSRHLSSSPASIKTFVAKEVSHDENCRVKFTLVDVVISLYICI